MFFAERAVRKVPGIGKETPVRAIESAAVVGAGTMGRGIATCFANAGIPVRLMDSDGQALERALAGIRSEYEGRVARGRIGAADAEARVRLIEPIETLERVAGADLVVEAVFEEMPLKEEVFRALDSVCDAGAIVASNTSYLDVNRLADIVPGRRGNVLGLHFFSPAQVMRLLEVIRTDSVAPETLASVLALAKRLGKIAVVAGVCHGFIGNRMLEGYTREVRFLLEEGASPAEIDSALTGFGMAMGPCAVADLAGLDVSWRKRRADAHLRDPSKRYSAVADRLCELGRFGQKTGAGYYRYEPGSRTPVPDPEVGCADRRGRGGERHRPAHHRRGRDRGALPLPAGERGRADPRRRHCTAGERHRHRVDQRLRLPALAGRRDALGGRDRARRRSRDHRPPRRKPGPLGAGAAC